MAMDYVAIIHQDPDSDFAASFRDFPGCITAGRTLAEARALALEALTGRIGVMCEAGEPVLAPSTLDTAMNDPRSGRYRRQLQQESRPAPPRQLI
jgi:predicted RNase H-like HicB family nuclease